MKRTLTLAALFAAGCAAALSLGVHRASAWGPNDLPPGWFVEHISVLHTTVCPESYRIWTTNRASWSDPFCTDSSSFQADFDAWVNSHYTPPPATTTAETVPPVTTTIVITTTTPAPTTATTATTSGPATATGPSAPAPAPEPAPVAVTNTVTVTTTVTPVEQSLQAQIDALAAQLASLTDRVTRLEKAGDAAWLAFQQSIANGSDPAAAADIARGTWLNAVNGLGEFAG
jgi:hypothetical protein